MSALGLSFPTGLLLGLLAIPLILLYFLKLRRRALSVSSTLLWRRVVEDCRANAPWERLRRQLLLLLQLLALALLVLGFAGPHLRTEALLAGRTILVLDASASMSARIAGSSRTRFDEARARIEALVGGLDRGRRVALVVAGVEPQVAAPLSDVAAPLLRSLKEQGPTEAPADLAAALELARALARGVGDSELVLVSDASVTVDSGLKPALDGVRVVNVLDEADPGQDENAGLVSLAIRPTPGALDSHQIFAGVQSHGAAARSLALVLESAVPPPQGESDPLQWAWGESSRVQLVLDPDESRSQLFEVAAAVGTALRVRIETDGKDLLSADDQALLVVPPREVVRALVVSPSPMLVEHALAAQHEVELFESAGIPADLAQVDVVIVEGELPDPLPGAPLLAFAAPAVPTGIIESPQLVRWNARHPALRNADLSSVQVAKAWRTTAPPGASTVLESDQGPLGYAWEAPGGRALWFPFQLTDSDLPLRVAFPVLFADALEWLTQRGGDEGVAATGMPRLERVDNSAQQAELVDSRGRALELMVRAGAVRVPALDRAGFGRLAAPGTQPRWLAWSLLSADESDIRPRLAVNEVAKQEAGAARREPGRKPLWPLVIVAAIAATFVEWTVFHRRRG